MNDCSCSLLKRQISCSSCVQIFISVRSRKKCFLNPGRHGDHIFLEGLVGGFLYFLHVMFTNQIVALSSCSSAEVATSLSKVYILDIMCLRLIVVV